MSVRRSRLTVILFVAAVGATSAALPGAPANADEATQAPVTADDRVRVRVGSDFFLEPTIVEVLANDSDPDGDPLEVCRVDVPDRVLLAVEITSSDYVDGGEVTSDVLRDSLAIYPLTKRAGIYELTYWACDFDYLTPATVTVTLKQTPQVLGTRAARPGRVRFTNPTARPAVLLYGNPEADKPDGRVRLPAGDTAVVQTPRRRLFWVAFRPSTKDIAGYGFIRGVQQQDARRLALTTAPRLTAAELRTWRTAR